MPGKHSICRLTVGRCGFQSLAEHAKNHVYKLAIGNIVEKMLIILLSFSLVKKLLFKEQPVFRLTLELSVLLTQ